MNTKSISKKVFSPLKERFVSLFQEKKADGDGQQPQLSEKIKRSKWKEYSYLFFCALIPAILVYLIYFARGHHPFGDGCVLVLDLNGQYVWFFEALRNFVAGDADLLYSFSRALGGEFLGIYAYYLASPLSFLVCLFPKDRMLEALLVLFMLKASLCGVTFGYYMHKTLDKLNRFSVILFSSSYALCGYAVIQQDNTMWIDALIWLPLITLGIESVIKYGKFKLYTVSLAIALFSNYYIGWMLCIYCLIYFFLYYFAHAEDYRNNPLHEKLHFIRSLLRMALYSLIALGMAAVILLAAFYSLNFGKTTFSDPSWEVAIKFDLLEFLYKLLPSSYDTVRPEGLPFVYSGLLTVLLIPSYFLSRRFSMRQKIFSAIFIFVMILSFSVNVVDLIWHGFQNPNWLNHRYSFMLSFYLCVLACRAFSCFEEVSVKTCAATGGLIALVCVILQTYTDESYVTPDDLTCIYLSLLLLFIYLCILALLRTSENKQLVSFTLLVVVFLELFLNATFCYEAKNKDVGFSKYSYYNNFLDRTRPITETIQESDTSFYRMEKTFFRRTNDNMALGIRGLSGSTSTLNKETIRGLAEMGYASKSHWSKYVGGTPVNDSLLGIKYLISDKNHEAYESYYNKLDTYTYQNTDGTATTYITYQNPYALSVAYGVSEDVLGFPMGFTQASETEEEAANDAKKKNSAVSDAVAALKKQLNQWLNIEENNLSEYADEYASPFEQLNAMVTAMLGEEEAVQIFVPVPVTNRNYGNLSEYLESYPKDKEVGFKTIPDSIETPTVSFSAEMPADAELFFFLPTNYPREVELDLYVDSDGESSSRDCGTFNANETACIISLGMLEEGDDLELRMTLTKRKLYWLKDEACFYYIDWAAFENAMSRLSKNQLVIEEYTERSFDGTYTASTERELVMTTLAYDNGWNIYVDGEAVKPIKAFGTFVAFYVEGDAEETHTIEMFYMPKTIVIGAIISTVSLLIFIALMIIDKRRGIGCRDNRPAFCGTSDEDAVSASLENGSPDADAEAESTKPATDECSEKTDKEE
ncbi:MAG: hypothetical protein E7643_05570 [Ruminococcaceae bacterium]|nr:hypothetical protein [Oscillospiraceae bacterium]